MDFSISKIRDLLLKGVEKIVVEKTNESGVADTLVTEDAAFISSILSDYPNVSIKGVDEHEIYKNLMRSVDNNKVEEFFNDLFALPTSKNNSMSERLRNEGNLKYLTQNYSQALEIYSKSLQLAEYNSETYVLTLGNRSAIFYQLKSYADCLKDIDLCLNLSYPNHLKPKLLLRKIQCYKKLGSREEMLAAVSDFKTFLHSAPLSANEKTKFKILAGKLSREGCDIPSSDIIHNLKLPETPVFDSSAEYPQVSSAVSLRHTNQKSSYVVATKDIKKGDVLFVEKALLVAPTNPEEFTGYLLCCYCLTPIIHWIPCRHCTGGVFCSEECRNSDWNEYHKWECYGKRVNFWKPFFEEMIAFRILLKSLDADLPNHMDKKAKVCMDKLKSMEGTLVKYFVSCSLIVKYLEKYTDFFERIRNNKKFMNLKVSEVKVEIGSLLLKYSALSLFEGVNISLPIIKLSPGCRQMLFAEYYIYAQGFYPLASNINHSCAPNATFYFVQDTIVIKADKDINATDEIYCSWYAHYKNMRTDERSILLLSKYNLKCRCPACSDPEFLVFDAIHCVKCHGPALMSVLQCGHTYRKYTCVHCKHEFGSHEVFKQELSVTRAFQNDDDDCEEQVLLNRIKVLQKACFYPNQHVIHMCTLLYFLSLQKRDLKQAMKYFRQFTDGFKASVSNNHYLDVLLFCVNIFMNYIISNNLFLQVRPVLKKMEELVDEVKMYSDLVYPGNEHYEHIREHFDEIVTICNLR